MKTVKVIWDAMRPKQTDDEMARLMFCKAQRLEESNEKLSSALRYIAEEPINETLKKSILETLGEI